MLSRQHIFSFHPASIFKHSPGPTAEEQKQYTITLGITKKEKIRTKCIWQELLNRDVPRINKCTHEQKKNYNETLKRLRNKGNLKFKYKNIYSDRYINFTR